MCDYTVPAGRVSNLIRVFFLTFGCCRILFFGRGKFRVLRSAGWGYDYEVSIKDAQVCAIFVDRYDLLQALSSDAAVRVPLSPIFSHFFLTQQCHRSSFPPKSVDALTNVPAALVLERETAKKRLFRRRSIISSLRVRVRVASNFVRFFRENRSAATSSVCVHTAHT